MKPRQSIIYLVVLLLAGGYYYFFEVVKKEQKEAAEKQARKVFGFQVEKVDALDIISSEKGAVQLKKNGTWSVVGPISAEADKAMVSDFLRSLAGLERERKIAEAVDDWKPFGLEQPPLRIRFQTGEQWTELILGGKTPVGEGRYACLGEKKEIFTVAEGNGSALNKGLNELRRKELLVFQPGEVKSARVAWKDGSTVEVERTGEGAAWKAQGRLDLKIKKSKVDNLLEQIHWLRARSFLENDVGRIESYHLKPPMVTVNLTLQDGRDVQLLLGTREQKEKLLTALSSQLPAIVEIDATVLDDLPKTVEALEDRSLTGMKSELFHRVKWRIGSASAEVTRREENKWALRKGDQEPQPMKDSWHVRSLFWDLDETEYVSKVSPASPSPAQPYARLDLSEGEKGLVTLTWEKPEGKPAEQPVTLWIERAGEELAVQVKPEALEKIEADLNRILQPERAKDAS